MQTIYLVVSGVVALAVFIPAIMTLVRHYGMSDPRTQVAVATVAGLLGSVAVVSLRADVIPDAIERALAVVMVGAGTIAVLGLVWYGVRVR